MTQPARGVIVLVAGAVLGIGMLIGTLGLPPVGQWDGRYGETLSAVAPVERQMDNVVTSINFDYRGIDTLGEEYMLFAASAGTALLLRRLRTESEAHPREEVPGRPGSAPSDALRLWGLAIVACTLLFGMYIVLHGSVSPGGGFQGGCVLATAWLAVFLSGEFGLLQRVTSEHWVQFSEAVGAGTYAATGIGTLLAGGAFLQNLLPLGTLGSVGSGGTILLINSAVGLEVTAGFVLILHEFLRQAVLLHGRP